MQILFEVIEAFIDTPDKVPMLDAAEKGQDEPEKEAEKEAPQRQEVKEEQKETEEPEGAVDNNNDSDNSGSDSDKEQQEEQKAKKDENEHEEKKDERLEEKKDELIDGQHEEKKDEHEEKKDEHEEKKDDEHEQKEKQDEQQHQESEEEKKPENLNENLQNPQTQEVKGTETAADAGANAIALAETIPAESMTAAADPSDQVLEMLEDAKATQMDALHEEAVEPKINAVPEKAEKAAEGGKAEGDIELSLDKEVEKTPPATRTTLTPQQHEAVLSQMSIKRCFSQAGKALKLPGDPDPQDATKPPQDNEADKEQEVVKEKEADKADDDGGKEKKEKKSKKDKKEK